MSNHDFNSMRQAMVSNQLRTTAVSDPRINAVMGRVAREDFVPEDRRALAYVDIVTPLGGGRGLSAPMTTARLLNEAELKESDTVLLIGAATGYAAALLSQLVASVTAVEVDAALAAQARANLASLANVTLVEGALAQGAASGAPYDVIVIDGAIEDLPAALTDQVREGGHVVAGLVDGGVERLVRGVKAGGAISLVSFVDADCARLPGFERPKAFAF